MAETFDPYHKWLGIPKPDQPPHHYRLLGVGLFEADPDVIEGAADRQMAHVQTHKSGPHSTVSQKLLNELSAAKICLLNPKKKDAYDEQLKQKLAVTAIPVAVSSVAASVLVEEEAEENADLADILSNASSISAIGKGGSAAALQRKKRQQQTAMMVVALGVALVAVLGFAGWKFLGGAAGVSPDDGGTTQPTPVVQADPPPVTPGSSNDNETGKEDPTHPDKGPPKFTKTSDDSKDPKTKPSSPAKTQQPPANNIANDKPDPKRPVDLMKRINLAEDIISGTWELSRGVLSSSNEKNEIVQFAVDPPEDYRLTIDVEPSDKYDSLFVGVPVAGRTVMAIIDGWNHTASGLNLLDEREAADNESTYRGGQSLKPGEKNTVVAEVRHGGFIRVVVNGQPIIEWRGEPSRLSHNEAWAPVKHAGRPFVGGHYGFKFSRLELEPLPPEAAPKIAKQPKTKPKPSKTEPNENERGDLTSIETGPKNKTPIPEAAELVELRKEIRTTFRDEFAAARNPSGKADLAEKLFRHGIDSSEELPRRYALLEEGRGLAAEAGQIELLLNCIKELRKPFDVDVVALHCDSLTIASKVAGVDQQKLAESSLTLVDEAIDAERYEQAEKLSGLARAAAVKAKDADLRKSATDKEVQAKRLAKDHAAVVEARDKLAKDADDADANLVVGRHLCLARDEWDEGLPLLAKGSDEALKRIAEQELAEPTDAEDQGKLGDAWWEAATAAPAADRELIKARARHWYEQALPSLTDARKKTVETRLGVKGGGATATANPLELLLKKAQTAIKSKKLRPSSLVGSSIRTSKAFDEINQDGGLLIGFNLTLRTSNDDTYINSLQPIFLTAGGEKSGSVYGRANRNNAVTIKAKEGYAVAMISLRANPTSNSYLTGLSLTFGKVTAKGLGKKGADVYESEWVGDTNRAGSTPLGVPGRPILGIYGFERNNNEFPTAMGIYVLP